jgi:nicotinamidase-related amidase
MSAALLVIDVQKAFDDEGFWGRRNNPSCEANVAALIAGWSPDLHGWLSARGISSVVLCGITTNHCVETTARMAANLGYAVSFVLDATHTFDRAGPDGVVLTAGELARATATSLHGEFASVVSTSEALAQAW